MRVTLLPDGSLKLDKPLAIPLSMYRQDEEDPLHYIPKFEECRHRENRCRHSPCGKRTIFQWWCQLYEKNLTLKDCEGCDGKE